MSNSQLVVKHNDLVEARYNLTLNEQKMILYAVSQINRENKHLNKIKIPVQDFTQILGVSNEGRYEDLKNLAKKLTLQPLEISLNHGKDWLVTTWLSSAKYISKEAVIEMEFNSNLVPYLLELKERFTSYELQNVIALKGLHSIKLYELLKQYQNIGVRTFSVEKFRKLLGLEDIYERTYDLDYHVITPAIKEINNHTDIKVSFDKERKGRKIIGFSFLIKAEDENQEEYVEYLKQYCSIDEIQRELGLEEEKLSVVQVMQLYDICTEKTDGDGLDPFKYCQFNYVYVKDKEESVRNMYGYLKKALEEDYAKAGILLKLV